jgi:hypothetical protein
MFNSRAEAERVANHLVSQLGLSRSVIRLDTDADSTTTAGSAGPAGSGHAPNPLDHRAARLHDEADRACEAGFRS